MAKNCGASGSNSSSDTPTWKYHVFLSFMGNDTRHKFTDHLYHAFRRVGINTFRDEEKVSSGEEIAPALLRAIEESRISVVVFSKNYACSTWCLDELVKIIKCKEEKKQMVLPIFYEVDPSEVRWQKGSFGNAMAIHEERFRDNIDKVQKWRSALQHAANIAGESYKSGFEFNFIEKITEKVCTILNRPYLHIVDHHVGLESRKSDVVSLLSFERDSDVLMLGIYGVSGIGKTTMTKTLYNLVAEQFESSCFLADVRECSIKQGLVHLQGRILTDMLGQRENEIGNVHKGIMLMKDRLCCKKILLILDDVNKLEQLRALAGGCNWFGPGSRIVITTRDKGLLIAHGVGLKYEVNELDDEEALKLFCWNAFKTSEPDYGYEDLSTRAVRYSKGLPLALEMIGSDLYGKGLEEWKCTLSKHERIMNGDIYDTLQISYENLGHNEKEIFLDIACFFKGERLDYVEKILKGCGFFSKSGIRVLEDKCFLRIQRERLWMHDLVEGMGREIVRRESEKDLGERSRLWFHEDALQVLTNDMGTPKIQGIVMLSPQRKKVQWSGDAFKKMINLRILVIRNACFSRAPKQLPNSLRLLDWEEYPSSSLPYSFDGNKLLYLGLRHTTHPVQLRQQFKFHNITGIDLTYCEWLKEVPDISAIKHLKELHLDFCCNLVKVHDSVGFLGSLRVFSAINCFKLRSFPTSNGLKSLQILNLVGCHSIEMFPNITQSKALKKILLSDTGIDIEQESTAKLLQEILDEMNCQIVVPGLRGPSFFHRRRNGQSISLSIRQGFPRICVSFAFGTRELPDENLYFGLYISMGHFEAFWKVNSSCKPRRVLIFCLTNFLSWEEHQELEVEIKQDWVQVDFLGVVMDISGRIHWDEMLAGTIEECAVYVHKQGESTNVSFEDPDDSSVAFEIPNDIEGILSGEESDSATSAEDVEVMAESINGIIHQQNYTPPWGCTQIPYRSKIDSVNCEGREMMHDCDKALKMDKKRLMLRPISQDHQQFQQMENKIGTFEGEGKKVILLDDNIDENWFSPSGPSKIS